jgi:hypothetical protein
MGACNCIGSSDTTVKEITADNPKIREISNNLIILSKHTLGKSKTIQHSKKSSSNHAWINRKKENQNNSL